MSPSHQQHQRCCGQAFAVLGSDRTGLGTRTGFDPQARLPSKQRRALHVSLHSVLPMLQVGQLEQTSRLISITSPAAFLGSKQNFPAWSLPNSEQEAREHRISACSSGCGRYASASIQQYITSRNASCGNEQGSPGPAKASRPLPLAEAPAGTSVPLPVAGDPRAPSLPGTERGGPWRASLHPPLTSSMPAEGSRLLSSTCKRLLALAGASWPPACRETALLACAAGPSLAMLLSAMQLLLVHCPCSGSAPCSSI